MPRPLYITCCSLLLEDRETGSASHINVLEHISFLERSEMTPMEAAKAMGLGFVIHAAWARTSDADADQEFEYQFLIYSPNEDKPSLETSTQLVNFRQDAVSRLKLEMVGAPPARQSGFIRVQNRLRAIGDTEWLSQEYAIVAECGKAKPQT
jgi:hypothetical protein